MVEQNKNLTEWREQLVAKNAALTEENTKLNKKVIKGCIQSICLYITIC